MTARCIGSSAPTACAADDRLIEIDVRTVDELRALIREALVDDVLEVDVENVEHLRALVATGVQLGRLHQRLGVRVR